MAEMSNALETALEATKELLSSDRLHALLHLILAVGNALNDGKIHRAQVAHSTACCPQCHRAHTRSRESMCQVRRPSQDSQAENAHHIAAHSASCMQGFEMKSLLKLRLMRLSGGAADWTSTTLLDYIVLKVPGVYNDVEDVTLCRGCLCPFDALSVR